MIGADDDALEPPGVEPALLEIEGPVAHLPGQQAPLQAGGQAADELGQTRQLVVQAGAQAVQLGRVAERLRVHGLVEGGGVGTVGRALSPRRGAVAHRVARVRVRPLRRGSQVYGRSPLALASSGRRLAQRGLRIGRGRSARLRLLRGVLLARRGLAVGELALLAGLAARAVQVERADQLSQSGGEGALFTKVRTQRIEARRDPGIEEGAPQLDHGLCRGWGRRAAQAFARENAQRLGERNLFAAGRAIELPVPAVLVDHGGDIGIHPGHPALPQCFDASLFDGLVGRARVLALQLVHRMEARIVVAQAQGLRIGPAAQADDLGRREERWWRAGQGVARSGRIARDRCASGDRTHRAVDRLHEDGRGAGPVRRSGVSARVGHDAAISPRACAGRAVPRRSSAGNTRRPWCARSRRIGSRS